MKWKKNWRKIEEIQTNTQSIFSIYFSVNFEFASIIQSVQFVLNSIDYLMKIPIILLTFMLKAHGKLKSCWFNEIEICVCLFMSKRTHIYCCAIKLHYLTHEILLKSLTLNITQ